MRKGSKVSKRPKPRRSTLVELAQNEAERWTGKAHAYALAILFAFVHRLTTGETVEELIDRCARPAPDFEI